MSLKGKRVDRSEQSTKMKSRKVKRLEIGSAYARKITRIDKNFDFQVLIVIFEGKSHYQSEF